jgi:hypothetical protein
MSIRFEYDSSDDVNNFKRKTNTSSDKEMEFENDWKLLEKMLIKDDDVDVDLTIGSDPFISFKWP